MTHKRSLGSYGLDIKYLAPLSNPRSLAPVSQSGLARSPKNRISLYLNAREHSTTILADRSRAPVITNILSKFL